MRIWRSAALALLTLNSAAGAACHRHPATDAPAPDPNAPVPLTVENHYYGDVVIYLVHGSQRERLGMVSALATATFSFPFRRLSPSGTSRLFAYPIAGSRGLTSDPLLVQPGQEISWTLESDLDRSSMTVF